MKFLQKRLLFSFPTNLFNFQKSFQLPTIIFLSTTTLSPTSNQSLVRLFPAKPFPFKLTPLSSSNLRLIQISPFFELNYFPFKKLFSS